MSIDLTFHGDASRLTLGLYDALTLHDGPPNTTAPFAAIEWDGNPARLTVDVGDRTTVHVGWREGIRRVIHRRHAWR